jgi:hypothetical protein
VFFQFGRDLGEPGSIQEAAVHDLTPEDVNEPQEQQLVRLAGAPGVTADLDGDIDQARIAQEPGYPLSVKLL